MILLITDGAPKTDLVEDQVLKAIKREAEMFKQEYKDTTFKLLTLRMGSNKRSKKFVEELTKQTVRNWINYLRHCKRSLGRIFNSCKRVFEKHYILTTNINFC